MPLPSNFVTLELDVQWGDMDALGHVNNTRYLTWFESARIALFARIGLASVAPLTVGPILATTTCDFLRPVVFPARIEVGVRVASIGETSVAMEYEVRDAAAKETLYARGSSVVVVIDYRTMKKLRVPDEVRDAIATL
jgi:acyl-CoA thioester hydrolase